MLCFQHEMDLHLAMDEYDEAAKIQRELQALEHKDDVKEMEVENYNCKKNSWFCFSKEALLRAFFHITEKIVPRFECTSHSHPRVEQKCDQI